MNIFKVNGLFSLKKLAAALVLTLGTGLLGAVFSTDAGRIYNMLRLPSFAPPAALFTPVWIVLFILMGFSLYRILMYDKTPPNVKAARYSFFLSLIFTLLWSILFFGFSLRIAALIDSAILLFYLIMTIIRFFRIDKAAAWFLMPTALWVAFATVLNFGIVLLNN